MVKVIVLIYSFLGSLALAYGQEPSIVELIETLPQTEELGFGYSATFAGSQFLPRRNSGQWSTGILGSTPPKKSESLMLIVKRGAEAIPSWRPGPLS